MLIKTKAFRGFSGNDLHDAIFFSHEMHGFEVEKLPMGLLCRKDPDGNQIIRYRY